MNAMRNKILPFTTVNQTHLTPTNMVQASNVLQPNINQTNTIQMAAVSSLPDINDSNSFNHSNIIRQHNLFHPNNSKQAIAIQNAISSESCVSDINHSNNINPSNNIGHRNNPLPCHNGKQTNSVQTVISPESCVPNMNQSNNINHSNSLRHQTSQLQCNSSKQTNNIQTVMSSESCVSNVNQSNNINHSNMGQQNNSMQLNSLKQTSNLQSQIPNESQNGNSNSDASNDISEGEQSKQPAKKGRKTKSNKSQWRKEKGNKYLNKPYRNYKGVEIKSKEFVDYDCHCTMKCKELLSADEREQEFMKFWELGSYEAQAIFLIARVDEQCTKKSKEKKKDTKDKEDDSPPPSEKKSKRQYSRTYILKSKQVCRDMFVKTLGITSKRINTALVKMRSKNLIDHRGLSQGGKNKISDKRYDEVVEHIKKMPRYKCIHLQGKMDTEYLNLPPELSLSKMYDLYTKEVEQPVSLSMYKKIYYGKFNFKTKGMKREMCHICKGDRKLKNAEMKRQQARDKVALMCQNNQPVLHEQYRPPNFLTAPPISCNQSWLPPPNFQMSQHQHNPSHYFDQAMSFE